MSELVVTPVEAQLDETVAIAVKGLAAGARVRLRLRCDALAAEAEAEFLADAAGCVDVASSAPIAGDYEGVDAAGLFWSARFDEGADFMNMWARLATLEPLRYACAVEVAGRPAARALFTRRLVAPHVSRARVRDDAIRGELFAASGAPRPGVVVLGGSDGGNSLAFVAALLAAHGFAALALPYFAHDDLPRELAEIPLEYFGRAIEWLRARPESSGGRPGVVGMSRGGELALLLGSTFPEISAVVALVPSAIAGGGIGKDFATMMRPAWTLAGRPVPFLPPPSDPESFEAIREAFAGGAAYAGTPAFRRSLAHSAARIDEIAIPVERTHGPIFMMSAEDDRIWPSSDLAEIGMRRLERAGFRHAFEHRAFRGAGHLACLPPNLPATSNVARHPLVPVKLAYGGTPSANAAASAQTWRAVLAFLSAHAE
jgi:dienelactone hydrolase